MGPSTMPPQILSPGCGSSSNTVSSADDATTTPVTQTVPAAPVTTTLSPADAAVLATITQRGKPTVTVPKTAPPTKLVVKDLIQGTGATATQGKTVTVNYVGVLYKGGKQFDSSWQRNQPFTTSLAAGSGALNSS